jgi:phosphatidate cytidylyltransferase
VLAGVVVAGGAFEWSRLCGMSGTGPWAYVIVVAAAFAGLTLASVNVVHAAWIAAAGFWALVVPIWLARGVTARHHLALAIAGLLVLVPAGYALAVLEPRYVLATLVLVWVADTAAYFVGRKWGRRKLAPGISPGKTWEGAWGAVAAAMAYAIICGTFLLGAAGWPAYLVVAAVLTAISIVGDLFESAAKRQAGVKDSGALLPGHGGLMDRIDSATAVLPVAALLLAMRS